MMFLVTLIISFITYYIFYFYGRIKKYPPGPRPLPLIGNLHEMNLLYLDDSFNRFSLQFGNVFTVYMPLPVVVVMDLDGIRECYSSKGDSFNGKPQNLFNQLVSYTKNGGIINAEGDNWREQRRAAISIFRDFGMGRSLMEEQVKCSINQFLHYVRSMKKKVNVDLRWPIQLMVGNIINETLFGYHYSYDDCDRLKEYIERVGWMYGELATSPLFFLCLTFPFLQKIPFIGHRAIGKLFEAEKKNKKFIKNEVRNAMKTKIEVDPSFDIQPTNFVEGYMHKMEKNSELNEDNLYALGSDLFTAGMETTTTTLRWALQYMAVHEDIQEKVRQEIYSVVGKERLPSMQDKNSLPFTCATIMEVQRVSSIVIPLGTIHRCTESSSIHSIRIPEDTLVAVQLGAVMQNEKIFHDPFLFNPHRLMTNDGKGIQKELAENIIPFGLGKRQCAGEGLARMELFLALSSFIQHFRITPTQKGVDMGYDYTVMKVPRRNLFNLECLI